MVLSKEFNYDFPFDEMVKDWEKDYTEEIGETPGKADINDFYNFWYNRLYSRMYFSDAESLKAFLIWEASYNEIHNEWIDYWKDKEQGATPYFFMSSCVRAPYGAHKTYFALENSV